MTSQSAFPPARATEWGPFSTIRLIRVVVLFTAGLLLLTAGWLLVRRVGGALREPLSGTALVLLGSLLGSMLLAAGHFDRKTAAGLCPAWDFRSPFARALLTVVALMSGVAVSLPGGPLPALSAFWLLILAGAVPAWCSVRFQPPFEVREQGQERNDAVASSSGSQVGDLDGHSAGCSSTDCEADEEGEGEQRLLPDDVLQRVVRARDPGGSEVVYGTVRCGFVAGQRQQSIHLAFCPPLQTLAHFATDQVAGPAVQIKTVVAETFGVGLEARLASPSKGPTEVQIQFFAFERLPSGEDE